jgi:hypothetical protein
MKKLNKILLELEKQIRYCRNNPAPQPKVIRQGNHFTVEFK